MARSLRTSRGFTLDFGFPSVSLMFAAYRQRRALARLDENQLADIGLTHDLAQAEAKRPIWDVPCHWLR